jgi:aspartate/methionine/tyrosine aminotransferase
MRKLTADESIGLTHQFNIADAHARAHPSADETALIDELPRIFQEAIHTPQREADIRAITAYAKLSNQFALDTRAALPVYSSSIGLEIVANALRETGTRVHLIEPTFDNIPDILKRNKVPLRAIPIDLMENYMCALTEAIGRAEPGDAIFIVSPNNPTGQVLGKEDFAAASLCCHKRGLTLILDPSFRLFEPLAYFDHYDIMRSAGVEFISIEDTGKSWASLDLKLAFICSSPRWSYLLKNIADDFLLNVSPFVSLLVEGFSELYVGLGTEALRSRVSANRTALRANVRKSPMLSIPYPQSSVSVELLQTAPPLVSSEVVDACLTVDLSVLSGEAFYWASAGRGLDLIRVALFRDPERFEDSTTLLFSVLKGMENKIK